MNAYLLLTWVIALAWINASVALNDDRVPATEASSTKVDSQGPVDQMADETIDLINRGFREIYFSSNYKNVVLVVGNTGAGKTTLTKFITGQPLMAYTKAGRYLIKDADNKISHETTSISKTIFPEMFIDYVTNTAYFDLPGFSDTRNASIELANAWFMKLVTDHVDKVKILFVVNYSSLRSGESRTDFKYFLENAIRFVLQPLKFRPAIALLASKVDNYTPDDMIVPQIAEFLETERGSLSSIFGADKLQKFLTLLDSFLIKSPSGQYERIGFFKQPTIAGPLSDIPEMKVRRKALKNLIGNQIQYVQTGPHDFGISVTDHARNYVHVIIERLNSKLTALMTQIGIAIRQHYQQQGFSNDTVESFLGKFIPEVSQLENVVHDLGKSSSRLSFIQIFKEQMPPKLGLNYTVPILQAVHKTLEFYETVDIRSILPDFLKWTQPLQETVNQLKLDASKFLEVLNLKAETYAEKILQSLEKVYEQTVQNGINSNHSEQDNIKKSLEKDTRLIDTLKNDLPTQISFNSFWTVIGNSLKSLSVTPKNLTLPQPILLVLDINFQSHPELKKDSWIRTVYQLQSSISSKHSEFNLILQEKRHKEAITSLNLKITSILEDNSRITKIAEDRERRLNESIIQQKRQAAETTKQMRAMAEQQVKLQKKMRRQKISLEETATKEADKIRKEAIAREESNRRRCRNDMEQRERDARESQERLEQQLAQMESRDANKRC